MAGDDRGPRRPPGWMAPGPPPAGAQGRADLEPAADEDLSYLTGDWRLFQKRGGHRWSMDDLVTAWVATRGLDPAAPLRALDLGCGLGSVLLMVAWRLPRADVTGVEAQPERVAMARRSLAYDGAEDRCRIVAGDLRALPESIGTGFDLITGTPPYFPIGTRTQAKAEVLPSRFELRGGVEAYIHAAAPRVAAAGRIVLCSSAQERRRVADAVAAHGLTTAEHWTIIPRDGKPPLVMIDVLQRAAAPLAEHRLCIRDRAGQWTPDFRAVRDAMGLPSQPPG